MHFNPLYVLAVLAVSVAAAPAPQHFSKMLDPELAVLDDIQREFDILSFVSCLFFQAGYIETKND